MPVLCACAATADLCPSLRHTPHHSDSSHSQHSLSQPSSSSPSTTPDTEGHPPTPAPAPPEQEDEPPPPPVATRPERTKSIVSNYISVLAFLINYL